MSSSIKLVSSSPGLYVVYCIRFSNLLRIRSSPRSFTWSICDSIALILPSRASMSNLLIKLPSRLLSINLRGVNLGVEIAEIYLLITLEHIGVITPLNCKP
jgi:hypothetical protein